MTQEHDLASRISAAITEREISPRPRWEFVARNALIFGLLAISIILGSLTVATSEFLFKDRDWDLYRQLGQRNTLATLQSLPFLWLAALGLLVWASYTLLSSTRRGYRFAPFTILGASVLASLALGSALFAGGVGDATHEYFRSNLPVYDRLVVSRDRFWMNPREGLLAGFVIRATSSQDFLLQDPSGGFWRVTVTGDAEGVFEGARVRLVGSQVQPGDFTADYVLPWSRSSQVVTTTTVFP